MSLTAKKRYCVLGCADLGVQLTPGVSVLLEHSYCLPGAMAGVSSSLQQHSAGTSIDKELQSRIQPEFEHNQPSTSRANLDEGSLQHNLTASVFCSSLYQKFKNPINMTSRLCTSWKTICLANKSTSRQIHSSGMFQCSNNHLKRKLVASSTVDQADVDLHTKQMKEWWDPNGPLKALQSMNSIRVPFVRDGLVQCPPESRSMTPLKGMKLLDVGCGGGFLSEPLAILGAEVHGIDASQELIGCASQHSSSNPKLANNKPTYYCSSVEDHSVNHKNVYDGVVASEIIEHVNNKELFVKSCIETLKPGGRIFFTTPNRTRLTQILGICVAEYVLNIIPKGTHQYEKLTTPTELTFLLERNNCHVEAIYGISYEFITNKWKWVTNQTLMFALQAVKNN